MKTNNAMKIIWTFTVCFFAISFFTYAQIDCPSDTFGWSSYNYTYFFGQYGGGGSVDLELKETQSGYYQVKIDWTSLINNDDIISDDILKKILEKEIVMAMNTSQSPTSFQVNVFFVTECKATVKLVLDLEKITNINCCNDGIPEYYYDFYDGQDWHKLLNINKEITCGYKCCERVYYCRRVWDNVYEVWLSVIDSVTTNSVTNCGGLSEYEDCLTGDPIPCIEAVCQ